ncbi:MAG: rhomboid family intramembrane serine protease [Desulfobacteraceae bacterium]|jgi:membrane associated rhomboid family serine protease
MRPLFARLSGETARVYGLVLSSSGIPYQTHAKNGLWSITVAAFYRRQAIDAVSQYLNENPVQAPDLHPAEVPGIRTYSALYVAPVLALIHWAIVPGYEHQVFVEVLGADADQIMAGELYRCITALFLHKDWPHVVNNVAGLILFGTVASSISGWGVAWLMILISGAAGNVITALWYQENHIAIGASTAVFSALGLCTAMNLWRHARRSISSWRCWLPLAGGLALLGFLGSSPHSDLLAHFFGFLAGLVTGGLYGWKCRQPLRWSIQMASAIGAVGLVSLCWIYGIYAGG